MSFKVIKPQLVTLIENTDKFVVVNGYPSIKFSGYPSAHVVPGRNDSLYSTTDENERIYTFYVRCFVSTDDREMSEALEAMEDLIDTVLDALDQEDLKSGSSRTVAINLPSNYTYLQILAHPSDWAEITEPKLLMAEITVGIKISVDIS